MRARWAGSIAVAAFLLACQKEAPLPEPNAGSGSPRASADDPGHPAPPRPTSPTVGWVAFSGPGDLYSVRFPGTPTTSESSETTDGNVEVTKLAVYETRGGQSAYVAAVSEVKVPGLFDVRAGVREVVKSALAGVGGTIGTEREIGWGAAVGREVTFTATVGGTHVTGLMRAYILAGEKVRYWRVMAMNTGGEVDEATRLFVEGFALGVPKAAQAPKRVAHAPAPDDPTGAASVAPIITDNITFVAPKEGASWFEMSFACLRAGVGMEAGGSLATSIYAANPMIEPAMKAAGIDPDRDIAAVGYWQLDRARAVYFAVALRDPGKIADALGHIKGAKLAVVAPTHWAVTIRGDDGPRTIHVRVVPLRWGESVPGDAWSVEAASATHLVAISFPTASDGKAEPVDPFTALLGGKDAEARIRHLESLLAAPYGRCALGAFGPGELKPGFALTGGRFAFALPEGKNDPFTQMLGSNRTVDAELELAMSPAPRQADVDGWLAETEKAVAGTVDTVRARFAGVPGAGAYIDRYVDLFASLGKIGLEQKLDGHVLHVSWKSDRITSADADAFEAKAEKLEAAPKP